jgi:SWI/SNF-related matrix-associated actin-dependent regulator of chromatin subfamily A-like protein 1
MALAEIVGNRIEVDIDPHRDKLLIRSVPGRKFDLEKQLWFVPLSWASCIALRGIFGESLQIGPELSKWAAHEKATRVDPAMQLHNVLDLEKDDPNLTGLYPFQKAGAEFLRVAQRALLADEMGTGKTIQTIAALKMLDAKKILIVCPNSVKRNWSRELGIWWPEVFSVVYQPGKKGKDALDAIQDGSARVLIINWENTWRLSKLAPFGSIKMTDKDKEPKALNGIIFDAVVADEAHRAKEPSAKQTRALWELMRPATYRFALTGTPVANSPRDLWSIMHGLAPEEYAGYTQFVDRYGMVSWNAFGGLEVIGLNPTTRDEFFKFFDPRFIRRSKELVLPELPPKIYTSRVCALPSKQKKAYKELEKMMLTELDSGDMAYVTSPLAKLVRLRQVAAAYVNIDDGQWELTEPSGKLDELDAVLEEAGDEQVVVFAEHRQLIDLYAKRLEKRNVKFGLITGGASPDERQHDIEEFKAGRLRIMLGTLGAGGEGVDGLQVASTVIFLQRAYSMIKDKQAEDRLHRDGQKNAVEVIDIVSEDTIEDRIFEVLGEKTERLEEICRDQATLRRLLGG